jgi:hypothetical protein
MCVWAPASLGWLCSPDHVLPACAHMHLQMQMHMLMLMLIFMLMLLPMLLLMLFCSYLY